MAVTDPTAATGRTDPGENQPGATAHLGANGGVAMTLVHPQRKILAARIRAFGTTTPARAKASPLGVGQHGAPWRSSDCWSRRRRPGRSSSPAGRRRRRAAGGAAPRRLPARRSSPAAATIAAPAPRGVHQSVSRGQPEHRLAVRQQAWTATAARSRAATKCSSGRRTARPSSATPGRARWSATARSSTRA